MKKLDILVIRMAIVLFTIASISCMTSKRFVRYANNHKQELAGLCSENFPVQTKLIKGTTDTVTKIEYKDKIVLNCPPVEAKDGKLVTNTVDCPPSKTITKYVNTVDTLKIEDTAKIYLLQTKLDKAEKDLKQTQDDLEKETASKVNWRNISFLLGLICAVLAFLFIRKL